MEQNQTNQSDEPMVANESFKAKLLRWLRIHFKAIVELLLQHLSRKKEEKKKED